MGAGCDGQIMRQEMLSVPNPIDLRPALEGPMAPSARPMRPSVIVVGSINVDFVVRVVRLPRPGETVSGGSYERHGGGKGANAAVAAARSGARVRLVAAVGDDELGEWQLAKLSAERIDTTGVTPMAGAHTGVALITVDADGENQIAVASGANALLDARAVERALESVEPAVGAVCLLGFEVPDAALLPAAEWAGEHRVRVIVNPAPARSISAALLASHPILTPNESEALGLTGEGNVERAGRSLHERSGAAVLVTRGADGVLLVDDEGAWTLPGPQVTPVDTTGAGDVFNGALSAALSRGDRFRQAVRWAMAAAAVSTTGSGARSAPSADEVLAFLAAAARG